MTQTKNSVTQAAQPAKVSTPFNRWRYFALGTLAFALWLAVYSQIDNVANWLSFDVLTLGKETATGKAVAFFFYDSAKILLLLVGMVYVIAWLRAGMNTERARAYLSGQGRGIGYVLGAGLGAVTPFCSCSSIPLFLGFTSAQIPVGVTMAFLITSPLINEIAVVLLWGLLGWKFTTIYVAVGMLCGVAGGIVMDSIRAERWLQPLVTNANTLGHGRPLVASLSARRAPTLAERHAFAQAETVGIFRKVWLWVVAGVALGASLHGYVPQEWFAAHLGAGQWWSVPVAVAVGIPLYANVTGIVPVMESLLLKGLPLGTTLAFCMSTVAASLPEVMMLRQVMSGKLLAVFIAMLLAMFTLVGWLFNGIGQWLV